MANSTNYVQFATTDSTVSDCVTSGSVIYFNDHCYYDNRDECDEQPADANAPPSPEDEAAWLRRRIEEVLFR